MASVDSEGDGGAAWTRGFRDLDRILRGGLTTTPAHAGSEVPVAAGRLTWVVVVLCMIYGACMGTFAILSPKGPGPAQVLSSMVKVPLLFYLTLVVTLPSLYVLNALVGSRLSFGSVFRLLSASLGVNVAVLASMGPIVAFFSACTTSYPFMVLLNVAVFATAGFLALGFLFQALQRLSVAPPSEDAVLGASPGEGLVAVHPPTDPRPSHRVRTIFRIWMVLFGLVGAQMGWVLRPFIGHPDLPFAWFRPRQSNFFEAVFHAFAALFS
jgi:hypothetical protein